MKNIRLYNLTPATSYKLQTTMETKPFWQSSTLWINTLGIILGIASIAVEIRGDTEIIGLVTSILNILNRFRPVEKTELTLK